MPRDVAQGRRRLRARRTARGRDLSVRARRACAGARRGRAGEHVADALAVRTLMFNSGPLSEVGTVNLLSSGACNGGIL